MVKCGELVTLETCAVNTNLSASPNGMVLARLAWAMWIG
jgi:hypothetical protein